MFFLSLVGLGRSLMLLPLPWALPLQPEETNLERAFWKSIVKNNTGWHFQD